MRKQLFAVICLLPLAILVRVASAGSPGDAVAGTYDILICKGTCSFSELANVIVKGRLVLFADKLEKVDLNRFDENRLSHHYPGEPINGCFSLQTVAANSTYAGLEKIGLTSWTLQDNQYLFSLGRSVDAGYQASVARTMIGLDGTGSSWGAGVAAPKNPGKEIVVARRTGDANISNCTFQTAEEHEFRRLLADPPREKMFALEGAYRKSLLTDLQASRSPRDWAMAGWVNGSEDGYAQILRARKAAPDDGLIQWIAVHRTRPSSFAASPGMYELRSNVLDDAALAQLQKSEPDNAVPWLMALRSSVYANDAAAIDAALARLAASSRCDDHAAELFRAQVELFRRHPPPDEYFALAKQLDPGWQLQPLFSKEIAPYYGNHYPFAAIGMNNLFFMSGDDAGLHELFLVCARGDRSAARIQTCATIGRLLAAKALRWRVREAGSMLLSEIPSFTDDDVERARSDTWIAARGRKPDALIRNDRPHIDKEMAFAKDWIETGSEFEAMRRELARSGQPLQPPADWALNKALYKNFEEAREQKKVAPAS